MWVLLHNTVALTLCHVKKDLYSHPLFILIVPDKQSHFTFVFYCTHLSCVFISPKRLFIFYCRAGRCRGTSRHCHHSLLVLSHVCTLRFQTSALPVWRSPQVPDPGTENVPAEARVNAWEPVRRDRLIETRASFFFRIKCCRCVLNTTGLTLIFSKDGIFCGLNSCR